MEQIVQPLPLYGYGAVYAQEMKRWAEITAAPVDDMTGWHEVVITAGGTQEPIDDVRYVGNFSSGRFGHALAQEYAAHGHDVALLAPHSVIERFGTIETATHIPFTSAESLRTAMLGIRAADLVLHAAAVADYTPRRVSGKISSDKDSLTIEMERTPKILSLLRNHFGEKTTLIGFKLLSGVSVEYLSEVAHAQIEHNSTDYSVANLLDDINAASGERAVHLLHKNGSQQEITGKTRAVAQDLYKAVKWSSRNEALRG